MPSLRDFWRSYADWAPFVRVGTFLVLALVVDTAARRVARRLMRQVGTARDGRPLAARSQRAVTLAAFVLSALRVVVGVVVILSLLSELGVNLAPILTGAGVVGAALAFGAQNVIKDYLAGFFILMEDQYGVGDYVKIGALAGVVEEISMRITVLRGNDGTTHVIPNGTVQTVSNLTSSWARVVVDVPISLAADADAALAALAVVAKGLGDDEAWKPKLLEAPEVAGVVAVTETSTTVRVQVRVAATDQWSVRNELLRRVKRAFDEAGVAFPNVAPPVS